MVEISYCYSTRFKKSPEYVFRFILLLSHHHIPIFVPPTQVYCFGYNYCIWNRLKALKTRLHLLSKIGRIQDYKLIQIIPFFYNNFKLLKMVSFLFVFFLWMKIQNSEDRKKGVLAEKTTKFLIRNRLSLHISPLYAHFMESLLSHIWCNLKMWTPYKILGLPHFLLFLCSPLDP